MWTRSAHHGWAAGFAVLLGALAAAPGAHAENTHLVSFDAASGAARCVVVAQRFEEFLMGLRWKRRVLLIFPGDDDNPYVTSNPGAEDRRLTGFALTGDGGWLVGADWTAASGVEARDADDPEPCGDRGAWSRYHGRYRVPPGSYAAILIGLDGGEKTRWETMPRLDEIFAVIDAMPMRRRELEARGE